MRKITKLGIGAAMLSATVVAGGLQPVFAQQFYGAPPFASYGYGGAQAVYGYDQPRAHEREREEYARRAAYRYGYNPYGTPPAIRCEQKRQTNTAGGAILGAIAGGLLGNSVSRGDRGAGTAIGAIAGGILGASIGNSASCQNRPYAYYGY